MLPLLWSLLRKILFCPQMRVENLKSFSIVRRVAYSRPVDQWLRSDLMVRRYKAYVPGFTAGSRWPLVFALVSKARGYHDHSLLSILLWARQDVRIYWRRKVWELRKIIFSSSTPVVFRYTCKVLANLVSPILNKDGHCEYYYYIGYDIRSGVWND
jgi:hypothetical protein